MKGDSLLTSLEFAEKITLTCILNTVYIYSQETVNFLYFMIYIMFIIHISVLHHKDVTITVAGPRTT